MRYSERPQSLMRQFLVLAAVVLALGMTGIGLWLTRQVERAATETSGAVTALYVDAMIAPAVAGMADGPLDAVGRARLDGLLTRSPLRDKVSSFKVWDTTGRIIYSTRPEQVGHVVADNPRLAVALSGEVYARLRDAPLSYTPDAPVSRLMEVYSPVRAGDSGRIIAVAEFYTPTDTLRALQRSSRLNGWLAVGGAGLAMFAILSLLFARGSRTILRQRAALDAQVAELSDLLARNRHLGGRVEQANKRSADLNERILRRVSADLHDGPAQLLAFASLRLDRAEGMEPVATAVREALQDMRLICRGLALPELGTWSTAAIARHLVAGHHTRTGTLPHLVLAGDVPELPMAARICLYRFLQEALANAAKHAPAATPSVHLRRQGDGLAAEVRDTGPGFDPDVPADGLGIAGLRERVAGLHGRFALQSGTGQGTSVAIWLPQGEKDGP